MAMTDTSPNFPPSLDRLGQRFALDARQAEQMRHFGGILANDEHAPTTVRDPRRVRDDHLADALVALDLQLVREASMIADLGAGAGVPGIPLAIALPETRVILIEGNGRKCEFMAGVVDALGLPNAEVVNGRAETWSSGIGQNDVVTARALAPLDVVAEYAAPLLVVGGALVAWRGARELEVEADARRAAEILGLSVEEPIQVNPYTGAENRYLHVMVKTVETPARFPRRDGVARKRPLGRG
jgi:16S rRNA (guanine527-N7)-methyltransferase